MSRSLSQILREADEVIEKYASEDNNYSTKDDDDLFKLAQDYVAEATTPTHFECEVEPDLELTGYEKMAMAIAVVETALGAKELSALTSFEKAATEKGFSSEQVQEVFNKVAAHKPIGRQAITMFEDAANRLRARCGT